MRRPSEDLQQRFVKRRARGISDADGNGYLYAYVHANEWKIGTTNDFIRRQRQWNQDCPDPSRLWLPPVRVSNRRRAGEFYILRLSVHPIRVPEALAHLMLETACTDRPRAYCYLCTLPHYFIFSFRLIPNG